MIFMKIDTLTNLLNALAKFKEEQSDVELIKIYYIDNDNFTIKGIDKNQKKCYTKKLRNDRKKSGFDSRYINNNK